MDCFGDSTLSTCKYVYSEFIFAVLMIEDNQVRSFCPLPMSSIQSNLKLHSVWSSPKVHAIYGFFFILCISHKGINHLRTYLSCEDQKVFHPLFIVQYLLIPINTIVDKYLLKMFFADTNDNKICGKDWKFLKNFWARRLKVKFIYSKLFLLKSLM